LSETGSGGLQIRLRVDDDGPGVPAEKREEIFGRGERADESTPGSGLGLSIVRDIATLYGGDVTLGEAPSGGLRAELVLPGAIRAGAD
jgi:signal transduction histidine kinase